MPYSISTEAEDCNGFAVVKDDDKMIMGCHETEEKAKDQITALNIAEAESKRQADASQDIYEKVASKLTPVVINILKIKKV